MSAPDMLEVINGPEDGTEFPIARAPVIVGMDMACEVNVRLDETIDPFHARLTVVSDGYRVRKIRGGRLAVNGKRTGVFRSRILRAGDILEVGNTELYLRCSPEGLAKRSRGLPTESDFFWTLKTVGKRAIRLVSVRLLFPQHAVGRLIRLLVILFVGATIVGYFWPDAVSYARYYVTHYVGQLVQLIGQLSSGPA